MAWMPDDREILRRALDEAVWRRRAEILAPLRELAKSAKLRHWRSALLALTAKGEAPPWLMEEPRAIHEK